MEYIDRMTQNYLQNIEWDEEPEYLFEAKQIRSHFSDSLNHTNAMMKMKSILAGYSVLVPIVEGIRNEKYIEIVDDPDFLQEFKKPRIS